MKRILLVGGGSGGHVFPLMAVAESLQKKAAEQGINLKLTLLGEGKFFEEAAKKSGLPYKKIMAGKVRRYFSLANFFDMAKIFIGTIQSLWHLFWLMPNVIFVKGGYASFPPALAAKFYFIPLFIHESDVIPGAANRLISRLAKKAFVSFEASKQYFSPGKTEFTGNPIRTEIFNADRSRALQYFQLSDQMPTVLVLGGSQGAQKINELILQSAPKLTQKFQIIHQTGDLNYEAVKKSINSLRSLAPKSDLGAKLLSERYHIFPFLDSNNLPLAYAAADVIVSRAGANFLFEFSALGKPAILIPLSRKASRGEQLTNAIEFSKYGGVVIEEENLVPSILVDQIERVYQNRAEISQKIKGFANLDAADKITASLLT